MGLWHCPEISWNENPSSPTRISWDGIPFFCSSDVFPNALSEGQPWQSLSFRDVFFANFHEEAERLALKTPLVWWLKSWLSYSKDSWLFNPIPLLFLGVPVDRCPSKNAFPGLEETTLQACDMRDMPLPMHAWDRNQHCPLATKAVHWPWFLRALALPGCRGSLSEQLMKQFNLREGQDDRHWNKWCGWNLMFFVAELVTQRWRSFVQWIFQVLAKGVAGSIWSPDWQYIPLIYHVYNIYIYIYILPSRRLYNPYHPLQDPE